MAKSPFADFSKELEKGTLRPLYAFVGEEEFLARRAMDRLRAAAEKKHALSVTRLFGKECNADTIVNLLRTVSLFGETPFVILRPGEKLAKDDLDRLAEYATAPVESSILVVMGAKIDGRSRFMQAIAKHGVVVECKTPYLEALPAFVVTEAREKGVALPRDAAEFIAAMVGPNLALLADAVERCILYVGEKKAITLADVEMVVTETHQHTIFELTDAIGARNFPRAMTLLSNVLANDDNPTGVHAMIVRHFRILAKAKDAAGRMDDRALAAYLGVHPFFVGNYIKQSRNFSAREIRSSFKVLGRCDRELKSIRLPKARVLEKALVELVK